MTIYTPITTHLSNQYKLHSFGTILNIAITGKALRLPENENPVAPDL
jgi:hypothetical protein